MKILKTILFETEQEFVNFINSKKDSRSNEEKEQTITHERAHFNMAVELGYNPSYCFREIGFEIFNETIPIPTYWVKVDYENNPNPSNLRKICLAPKEPSYVDKKYGRFPTFYTILWKIRKRIFKKEF